MLTDNQKLIKITSSEKHQKMFYFSTTLNYYEKRFFVISINNLVDIYLIASCLQSEQTAIYE
jgi:hypothetical protein